jgi:hypothetical protein
VSTPRPCQWSKKPCWASVTAGAAAPLVPIGAAPSVEPGHPRTRATASGCAVRALPAAITLFTTLTRPAGPATIGAMPHSNPAPSATFFRL